MNTNYIFQDKFDKFSTLVNMASICNKLTSKGLIEQGLILLMVVDDDFFSKLGSEVTLPNIKIIKLSESIDQISKVPVKDNLLVYFYIEHAQDGLKLIDYLIKSKIKYRAIGVRGAADYGMGYDYGSGYVYDDRVSRETIEAAYIEQSIRGFSKFDPPNTQLDFVNLTQALASTNHLDGDIVEIGCFRGSSGSIMLDYAKNKNLRPKNYYFFDTFTGFDYPESFESADSMWQGTHSAEGVSIIGDRLKSKCGVNTVHVQKLNIISDAFPIEISKIAVANIDVDLYEAVCSAINVIAKKVCIGGIMICEDAGHTPHLMGARLAVEEFLSSALGPNFTKIHMESGQIFLIRHT